MDSITFFLIGLVMASIAIVAQLLKIKKKMKPKIAWIIWWVTMGLWLICLIVGWILK